MPYTLAELLTRTRDALNEATAGYWTDAQLTRYLGDAAAEISAITRCLEATTSITLAENDRDYDVPSDSIEIRHAQIQSTQQGLIKITPTSAGHHSLVSTDDTPLRWYEWNRLFYIEPIPNATMDGTVLDLFYARTTQDITLIPDYLQLPGVDYAVFRAKIQDHRYADAAAAYSLFTNNLVFRANEVYQHTPHAMADFVIPDQEVLTNG